MTEREELRQQIAAIGAQDDAEIDIGRAALLLAALDRPGAPLAAYVAHLAEMAALVAAAPGAGGGIAGRAAALADAIGNRLGYAGDTQSYEDPQNADLMRVIDRRMGLPVALGILYIHAARAQGWDAAGLNFPGHFLVRLQSGARRAIIDPFNRGAPMGPEDLRATLKAVSGAEAELRPEHHMAVGARDVLVRLLNNIKLRAAQMDDPARALDIIDRILLIAPTHTDLLREAGLFHARLGNLRRAQEQISAFIDRSPDPARKAEGEKLLQQLRARLN